LKRSISYDVACPDDLSLFVQTALKSGLAEIIFQRRPLSGSVLGP